MLSGNQIAEPFRKGFGRGLEVGIFGNFRAFKGGVSPDISRGPGVHPEKIVRDSLGIGQMGADEIQHFLFEGSFSSQ